MMRIQSITYDSTSSFEMRIAASHRPTEELIFAKPVVSCSMLKRQNYILDRRTA